MSTLIWGSKRKQTITLLAELRRKKFERPRSGQCVAANLRNGSEKLIVDQSLESREPGLLDIAMHRYGVSVRNVRNVNLFEPVLNVTHQIKRWLKLVADREQLRINLSQTHALKVLLRLMSTSNRPSSRRHLRSVISYLLSGLFII